MKKETYVLCKMINCGFRHKKCGNLLTLVNSKNHIILYKKDKIHINIQK